MISHLLTLAAPNACPLPAESGGGFFGPIARPLAAVLAAFYHVVPSFGVAILALSVAWMIIISPLTLKSTRSMLAMQKIQPEIKRLQEKYKNDRQAFAQAQMDLFKERGVSPFGSCLPTLLPLPVFFALFRLIDGLSHKTNGCPAPQFLSPNTRMFHDIAAGGGTLHSFGMNLAQNALSSHSSFLAALPFYVLLLIMGGTQYLQTQQMMSRNQAAADNPQMRMMKYLPLVFMAFCIRFPAGVVLYYSMSNLCRIAQQSLMYRYDPKVRTLAAKEVVDVESYTKEHEEEHRRERAQSKGGSGAKSLTATNRSGSGADGGEGAKPARSRFSALLDAAKEQKARDLDQRAQAKSGGGGRSAGGKSGSAPRSGGGKSAGGAKSGGARSGGGAGSAGGGRSAGGGKSAGGARSAGSARSAGGKSAGGKAPAGPKRAAGANTGAGSGRSPGNKNRPPGAGADRGKSDRSSAGGNGNQVNGSAAKGAPPRSGGQRTGAGNRTGARSGGNKKRRGR